MSDDLHMSWCVGDHNGYGDCIIVHRVQMGPDKADHVDVELNGARCDHFAIYLSDGTCLGDGEEVDEYIEGLAARQQALADLANVVAELRPLLDQSDRLGEMDCDDSHDHD